MSFAVFCKIHAGDRTQLDTKGLEEDCKDVGHQNNEEQLELERSTSRDIGSIVS